MRLLAKYKIPLIIGFILPFYVAMVSCTNSGKFDVETAQTYTVNSAALTNSIVALNASFAQSTEIANSIKPHLTGDELVTLDNAAITLAEFHAQVNKLLGPNNKVTDLLVNAATIKPMYINSRQAYIEARTVIVLHWDKLPFNAKASLKEFDNQANIAHQSIMALQRISQTADAPIDITQTVSDFISVGAAAAQVLQMTGVLK